MMKRIFVLVFALALSGSGVVFTSATAEGETRESGEARPSGIVISPAFQEIILEQTETDKEFFVSVSNDTETSVNLHLSILDFGSLDESGGVAFLGSSQNVEKKYALASWMRAPKENIALQAGESVKVSVIIQNQDTLSPGGHYGALVFQSDGDLTGENGASTIAVNQLLSTLIFVKKIGGEIYGLDLREKEYDRSPFIFQDTLRLRFQNSGNVHVVPRGTALIRDPFGRIVAKGIINQESTLILPETSRLYPVPLRKLGALFIPGRYTLEISYRYDGKEEFTSATETYFFVPLLFIASLLIFLGGFGAIAYRIQKKKA